MSLKNLSRLKPVTEMKIVKSCVCGTPNMAGNMQAGNTAVKALTAASAAKVYQEIEHLLPFVIGALTDSAKVNSQPGL